MYQIWDGFCAVAKLNGGRRSSATLTVSINSYVVKGENKAGGFFSPLYP